MIAIAGPNLPHEVLLAAGCHAGPVRFDLDRPTPKAEQWLESKFAPWSPMVLQAWADGAYDHLESVLFSRAEDTSQRLYYYVCELQRLGHISGPKPRILDIAKIPRDASLALTSDKVRALITELGVENLALENAIVAQNKARSAIPVQTAGIACMVAGSAPPDHRLHNVISAAGFVPVGRTLAEDWADLGEPVDEGTDDPAAAIARQIHARVRGSRSFADPAKLLKADIARCQAGAVILWRIEEDEAQSWHLPAERRALEELNIPALVLTRRDWLARDGAAEEISQFLEGIRA